MNALFNFSPRAQNLQKQLAEFMHDHVLPAEAAVASWQAHSETRWLPCPTIEVLKQKAKDSGLWNLFLPDVTHGAGLSNLEYAPLAEQMGRVLWASEVFNCNAPDTGNMEVLAHFANEQQKQQWLAPLLNGEIRSAFAMTEPDVGSSDASNIALRIESDGDDYILNGRKWWITGAGDPRCKILIVMGVTNPDADKYARHSMILVPMETEGLRVVRALQALGFDDAPSGHMELEFKNVRVPKDHLLQTEGSGFALAQARLGPGRIHHCMRLIGLAQRALELMIERAQQRVVFGKPLAAQGMAQEMIALSRCEIEQARLLTLNAAAKLDQLGNKAAKDEIGMIKIIAPRMAFTVINRAIQLYGSGGLEHDFLAHALIGARCLQLADGPDEVHIAALARSMLK
jgi:acyl-CoA dehydrogenase